MPSSIWKPYSARSKRGRLSFTSSTPTLSVTCVRSALSSVTLTLSRYLSAGLSRRKRMMSPLLGSIRKWPFPSRSSSSSFRSTMCRLGLRRFSTSSSSTANLSRKRELLCCSSSVTMTRASRVPTGAVSTTERSSRPLRVT